jgi:hypothetical protein
MTKRSRQQPPPENQESGDQLNAFQQFAIEVKAVRRDREIMFDLEYLNDADELFTDTCTNQWFDALDAFESGDKSRLVKLMKSFYPIPKNMRPHIGDMLDRWDFVKPKHRMRVPSHRMTDDEIDLYQAVSEVDDLLEAGKSAAEALDEVAKRRGLSVKKLKAGHAKQISRERRIKAREYDAKRRDVKSLYAKRRRKRANPVAG